MATKKCPAPKGITLTRKGVKMTAKWSSPDKDKVSKQSIVWMITDTKGFTWDCKEASVGTGTTSSTLDLTEALGDYYPNGRDKIKSIKVKVTNKKSGSTSASTTKSYALSVPKAPAVAFAVANERLSATVTTEQGDKAWRRKVMGTFEAFDERGNMVLFETRYWTGDTYTFDLGPVTPNPKDAIKFVYVIATSMGPRGDSKAVTATHSIAVPNKPTAINVIAAEDGIYFLDWRYDSLSGWRPADSVEVLYHDFAQDEVEGIDSATFSKAKSGIGGNVFNTQTENLGPVPAGKRRHFRVAVTHDTNINFGSASSYDWGRPLPATNVEAEPSIKTDAATGALLSCYEVSFEWPDGTWPEAFARVYMDSPVNEICAPIPYGEGGTASVKSPAVADDAAHRFGVRVFVASNMDRRLDAKGFEESDIVWSDATVAFVYGVQNLTVTCREDGQSVDLQWDNAPVSDGGRPVTGVQVAHSGHIDAFVSNEQPTITEFDSTNYADIESLDHVVLYGLETGKEYYFWVRRFRKAGDDEAYGLWELAQATVGEGTEALVMANALKGCSLTLARTWVAVDSPSVAAAVYCTYDEGNGPQGASVDMLDESGATVRTWTLEAEQESIDLDLSGIDPGAYTFTATAVNSAGSLTSEAAPLSIVERPTCSLMLPAGEGMQAADDEGDGVPVLASLPLVAQCSGTSEMALTIKAEQSFETETPDGRARLYEGQVVHAVRVAAGEEEPVEIGGADLLDGAVYTVELIATDAASGLSSEPATARFRVDWERKAEAPGVSVDIDPGTLSATVTAAMPEGGMEGDRCDIYRVAADGAVRIASDAEWGRPYLDPYAPFNGEGTAYRAATRTPYGSTSWADLEYRLSHDSARIDWPYGAVELPWSIAMSDARTKDSTVEKYLGGERRAHIGAAVARSVHISTELDPDVDAAWLRACVELSKYAGTCLVRTAEGDAFCAVVDVSLDRDGEGPCVSVSIDAEETDPNGDYSAMPLEETDGGDEA